MSALRVERAEAIPYALEFRSPYVTARGTLARREMVLLRLRTSEPGLEGLGEAVPLSLRGDDSLAKTEGSIADAAARLVGLELAPALEDPLPFAVATIVEMTSSRKVGAAPRAAIECAVFDLVARVAGVPLWRLLGAPRAEPVLVNATVGSGAPDEVARAAAEWRSEGYETVKLKLGTDADVEMVAAVREAVGRDTRIRVDANAVWRPKEAMGVLSQLEPFGVELCEQPVAGLGAMARVARNSPIPIAADESLASEADAHRIVRRGAVRFGTAKLSKVGGIGAARKVAASIPTYLSSALDGPVGIAAAGHAAQLLSADGNDPGIAHGLATQRLFAEPVASVECRLAGGRLHLPGGEAPGLGVSLDEDAIRRHSLREG